MSAYDIGEESWILERPSVAEMKRQYEEMVSMLNNGDPVPYRSTNKEKIMYLRRKKLQEQVPTQDKRPKFLSRFSMSIPLNLNLPEVIEEEEIEDLTIDFATNTKKIESVEEWWSDFHSHNVSIKYHINVGSLSIGDQAIMELTSKLLPLIDVMTAQPVVTHLDVSWNDLYEEGMVAFSGLLGKLAGLSEIRLDGNQMGTTGLEACLTSMCRVEKKRNAGSFNRALNGSGGAQAQGSPAWRRSSIPNISLSLRETNIGDESMQCLASFLKPLPDNKKLHLVQLDLTNTYIFDGITAITLALQNNTILTTLILNSNMIGDQGAFAVGELLLTNRTINRLEMRNCDIGPSGTVHLCEGLQGHKGVQPSEEEGGKKFTIDVGLNPWDFPGELLLLQTSIAKPDMNVLWREGDWEPGDEEEISTLIRTFGETVVMERLMDGKGFLPLASPSQLISSPLIATYAPVHIATLSDHLSSITPHPSALPLLSIIVQLMQIHGRTNYRSWMTALPPILAHLSSWMDPSFVTNSKVRRQIEVLTLDLLSVLANINQHIIEDIIVCSGIVPHCLDNFLAFPNHNVYHLRLLKFVENICSNTICGTLRGFMIDLITGDFFNKVLAVIKEQSMKQVRSRDGSLTAAIMFVKAIEPHLETRLALSMKKAIKPFEDEQKGNLCCPPPPRSSAKMVLNKNSDI